MKKLNNEQIEKKLEHFPNWSYEDDAIHISFEF
ncbi:pterin-4a-carbinolamine dehydratase, partial [Psychroflexus sp. MBR-150]